MLELDGDNKERLEARLKALEDSVQTLSDEVLYLSDKLETKADLYEQTDND